MLDGFGSCNNWSHWRNLSVPTGEEANIKFLGAGLLLVDFFLLGGILSGTATAGATLVVIVA